MVSLCADSLDLFDYNNGIFVPGAYFNSSHPNTTGNYYQSGSEWERIINVEYIDLNENSGINQICGLRTHGNRAPLSAKRNEIVRQGRIRHQTF